MDPRHVDRREIIVLLHDDPPAPAGMRAKADSQRLHGAHHLVLTTDVLDESSERGVVVAERVKLCLPPCHPIDAHSARARR